MANEHTYHGTEMEISFLTDIGHHTDKHLNRTMLLENYIASARKRVDWGRIDKLACLRYADQLLGKEK
jgi:hypothetical protein